MSIAYKKFRRRLSDEELVVEDYVQSPSIEEETSTEVDSLPEGADVNLWEHMTKKELDKYAYEHAGIELDRRQSKSNMIKEFLTKLKGE